MRTRSGGIAASAWFSASIWSRARLRNSSTDKSAYWMCRPIARSGQSICTVTPAAAIASYPPRHCLRDRGQVRLLVRVVVVTEEQRDDPRRGGAEEHSNSVPPGHGGFQVVDVGEWCRRVADPDRAGAGGRSAPRSAGIAEHPLRQVRELGQVLIDKGIAAAAETGQPVLDVGGVARFRHLAIVDEIDTCLDLLLHHLGDGGADPCRQRGV